MSSKSLSLDALALDFSRVDECLGLPRALINGEEVDIFSVPNHFAHGDAPIATMSRWGRELSLCLLFWHWDCYSDRARGANRVGALGTFAEIPQAVRFHLRRDIDPARWGFFQGIGRAIAHAVTAEGTGKFHILRPADIARYAEEEAEWRLRAILAGRDVPKIVFVSERADSGILGDRRC